MGVCSSTPSEAGPRATAAALAAPGKRAAILASVGAVAMALGLLVYLADRDLSRSALIPAAAALSAGPLIGTLGQWLPSFVHPFAFSLFTAAAARAGTQPAYRACAGWWIVNVAFEAGQHPRASAPLASFVEALFGQGRVARGLSGYFVHGTFDLGDIVAATSGALAAAGVLFAVHRIGGGNANRTGS